MSTTRQADEQEVTLHAAVAAFPTPTTGTKLAAASFSGKSSPRVWVLSADCSAGATFTNGQLCRKHGSAWRVLYDLNDGSPFTVESGLGREYRLEDIAGDPTDEYAIKGSPSAGNWTFKLRPLQDTRS